MNENEQHLSRILNLRDLYLLIIGAVIGSGIFLIPSSVLQQSGGSIGLALGIWFAGGILSLLGALTYGELSARNPLAGGLYIYIRDAFGKVPAFLYGWALFFVIANGAVATLAVALPAYLNEIVPIGAAGAKIVALGMIVVVAVVNVRGTRQSADLQNWTTGIKVTAIIVLSAVLIIGGRGATSFHPFWPTKISWTLLSSLGIAMIGVLWAYEGWQFATFNAAEVINPQRTFPRGFLFGMLTLILLYMFANIGYISALGPAKAAESPSIAATSLSIVVGPWAGKIVAAAILISMFSAANSIMLSASRVYYAMAADGLFFAKLAEIHPRFKTPALSVIAGSIWAMIMALTGTFQQLLTYVVFTGWIFYSLAAASIFVYRKRKIGEDAAYRVPAYPITPLLFILSGAALVTNTLVATTKQGLIGLLLLFSGIPAYVYWHSRSQKNKEATAGTIA